MKKVLVAAALLGMSSTFANAASLTRVTVLVDAFADRADLKKDWGYSVLVEHNGKRILFDAGNDAALFKHNVETLGIDLRNLDFVVISHRHGDHTDGLKYLLAINPGVTIHVANDEYFGGPTPPVFFRQPAATLPARMRYFDGVVPDIVPHGSPWAHAKLQRIATTHEITPGIRVVRNIARAGSFTETPELSLVIDTPHGQIVIVGCSHPGVEQILESVQAKTRPVRMLMGGLHWVTTADADVRALAHRLSDEWKVQNVAPGHCTGERGFAALSELYGRRYHYAGLGATVMID